VADVIDRRRVTSSDGQSEKRYVIRTDVALGDLKWPIELSLTNRRSMRFRMLMGRAAISGYLLVDPSKSYLNGRRLSKLYPKLKRKR
jgi:ribosomal protein S6--L-glutamate ligase